MQLCRVHRCVTPVHYTTRPGISYSLERYFAGVPREIYSRCQVEATVDSRGFAARFKKLRAGEIDTAATSFWLVNWSLYNFERWDCRGGSVRMERERYLFGAFVHICRE